MDGIQIEDIDGGRGLCDKPESRFEGRVSDRIAIRSLSKSSLIFLSRVHMYGCTHSHRKFQKYVLYVDFIATPREVAKYGKVNVKLVR